MTPASPKLAIVGDDAPLDFIDDTGPKPGERRAARDRWRVLVVDDDPDVHDVTRFALGQTEVLGRRLELLSAYSAAEAKTLLETNPDAAVLLLDVVMEERDSGLKFVEWMRERGFDKARIILRTGQPGYAPELDVVRNYDINDYRAKSELNETRLITSLTAAIRSFEQIETIERSRQGLEMIVASCSQLFQKRELADFSRGVLMQIASLCGIKGDGLVCATRPAAQDQAKIVSGLGALASYIGRNLADLPDDHVLKAPTLAASRDGRPAENALTLCVEAPSHGRFVAALDHHEKLDDTDAALLGVFAANITVGFENVGLIERLDRLAFWDEAVELRNRNALIKDLARETRDGTYLALLRVVSYSETLVGFGQSMATGLLREVARRLQGAREAAEVYRYAEDVLAIVVRPGSHQESVLGDLQKHAFTVAGQTIRARVSIGYAPVEPGVEPALLAEHAYAAMSLGEAAGQTGPIEFKAAIADEARARIELTAALRDALDRDGIDIVFQPLVDLSNGSCTGFEALARWKHEGKSVSPGVFIPLAEQTGLSWSVFALGVKRAAEWYKRRDPSVHPKYVSVNLAACDLQQPDFVRRVVDLLARCEMPAAALQIEITEQSLIGDFATSQANLRALKDLGCRIAIDDFGTGYSSLSYVGKLPIDVLKLDRQFVVGLADDPACQAVAILTQELARRLNLEMLAEGVETAEQQAALEAIGCKYVQGYRFALPMAPDDLEAWFAARGPAR